MSALHSVMIGMTIVAVAVAIQSAFSQTPKSGEQNFLDRGRYLVKIAGCNDCHTPGYADAGGQVPESQWLTGGRFGFRGPWGTTYPANLRLYMQTLTEEQWVEIAKTTQFRPPMPWFALRDMTAQDLRAIYRFTKDLGPAGEPAHAYVPPDEEPEGPYFILKEPAK